MTKKHTKFGRTLEKESRLWNVWRKFRKNKLAMVGMTILIFLLLVAVFADVIADYDTQVIYQNRRQRLVEPCAQFWFGTDALGRDVLARVVH